MCGELEGEIVVEVAAGEQFTLVATAAARLFAFGWNAQGQLGLGSGQAAARMPTRIDLPAYSPDGNQWEMRAQWSVQCSFPFRQRKPSWRPRNADSPRVLDDQELD